MTQENNTQKNLREIFTVIENPSSNELRDNLVMQLIENGKSAKSLNTGLDRLLTDLSHMATGDESDQDTIIDDKGHNSLMTRLDAHLELISLFPLQDDTFPEHPLQPDQEMNIDPNTISKAFGSYAQNMVAFAELRSHNFNIPDTDALNQSFAEAGNGDILKQEKAANELRERIAASIEIPLEKLKRVQDYLDRILEANGNTLILKGIANEVQADIHTEKVKSAHITSNVISLWDYPRSPLVKTP